MYLDNKKNIFQNFFFNNTPQLSILTQILHINSWYLSGTWFPIYDLGPYSRLQFQTISWVSNYIRVWIYIENVSWIKVRDHISNLVSKSEFWVRYRVVLFVGFWIKNWGWISISKSNPRSEVRIGCKDWVSAWFLVQKLDRLRLKLGSSSNIEVVS